LIYTTTGGEGSYGGLIAQTHDDRIDKILRSALYRAQDCSTEPVCYNTSDAATWNYPACYNYTILPETSCEYFNQRLDRALLIDPQFGFFRNIVGA
jgi:hypothetical protein